MWEEGDRLSGSDSIVLMCPDFNSCAVEAALDSSLRGEIYLETDVAASDTKETLTALAVSVDLYVEEFITKSVRKSPRKKATVNYDSNIVCGGFEECDIEFQENMIKLEKNEDEEMSNSEDDSNGIRNQGTETQEQDTLTFEEEDEEESTLNAVTGQLVVARLKCPLCSRGEKNLSSLKRHMSHWHFREEILELAGIGDEAGKMCHLCGKDCNDSNWESLFRHISIGHKYLDKVMPEPLILELNKYVLKVRPKTVKRELFEVTGQDVEGPPCPLCDLVFGEIVQLKRHLINKHYKDDILKVCPLGDNLRRCRLCQAPFGSTMLSETYLRTLLLIHIASKHGYLEKCMDSEMQRKWTDIKKKYSNKSKREEELKANKGSVDTVLNCPVCQSKFQEYKLLKRHICCHFKKEFVDAAGVTEEVLLGRKCNLCGLELAQKAKKRYHLMVAFSIHLATKHNFLETVVPDEIKRDVNNQVLRVNPTIYKEKLLPISTVKKSGQMCLLCDKYIETPIKYNNHLIWTHLRSEVLAHRNTTDYWRCNVCLKPLGRESNSKSSQMLAMARHLGVMHNFLEEVMDRELKERWQYVMQQFKSKESGSS